MEANIKNQRSPKRESFTYTAASAKTMNCIRVFLLATWSAITGVFVCFRALKFDENEENAGMHAADGGFQFDDYRFDSGSHPRVRG
jgi:hypothetical protein